MKKIGIDARLLSQTGVGVYIKNLLLSLEKMSLPKLQVYVYLLDNDYRDTTFKNPNFVKRKANFHWHTFAEQTRFLDLLLKDSLDLMHFTYFSYPVLYRRKFVSTIHDLTPLLFKTGKASTKNQMFYAIKYQGLKIVLSSQIKNSSAIITPTRTVKKQIVENYGDEYADKIFPIYEGINTELKTLKENKGLTKKFKGDFFICVNNFYPHKNTERLIKAFSHVKGDSRLVLIGPNDFFAKEIKKIIETASLKERIIVYTDSTLADLAFFYKNAKALLNPSLSEGFGLPNIEALYFGCPVIASDIDVFNEVLDDSFIKFNPYDVEDISHKINLFLEKQPKFDHRKLLEKYSFEDMAAETLKIYQNLLK